MALPKILVIDPDEGFGTMLKEGLAGTGYYTVQWVDNGKDAIKAVRSTAYDLTIIDIGISDMSPYKLILGIRHFRKDMRIMLIPFFGQDVPDNLKKLKPNGILSKPFFVGDLPDLIDDALGRPRTERAPVAPPPEPEEPEEPEAKTKAKPKADVDTSKQTDDKGDAPVALQVVAPQIINVPKKTVSYLRSNETEILRILDDLNREVRAEAILLIAGLELIAQAGVLSREQCKELTTLVAQSSQAAAEAAKFLGEPDGRFGQSLHEGTEYRLYSLSLSEGIVLSLALSSNVPLGMIRHQCRQAAEQLSQFII
jgi:DNA-binding response OmpR family regulator/predicted regulator of Ras-like GTPase activity (Roadblock/LC7/MglB family)